MLSSERNTKAAVLYSTDKPLQIRDLALPSLSKGQVLVDVMYSGVCRSQLMEARGGRGVDPWLPHLLGHEGSGIVREIGPEVTRFRPGDAVILGWIRGSGIEANGAKYKCSCTGEIINSGRVTTFSTSTVVSENRLIHIPEGIPMDVAVLFGCALPTGAGMVFNELRPCPGESVAVVGLGGIGLSALLALADFDCSNIIAIDISEERLNLALKFGATVVFDARIPDVVKKIIDSTGGGVDACIESGGSVQSIELGFEILKDEGRLHFASHPPEGEKISLRPHDLIRGKKIFGSWGGHSNPVIDSERLAALYRNGKLPLEQLVTRRYPLELINEALDDLEAGRVLRPLIDLRSN